MTGSVGSSRSIVPWLAVVLVIVLAAGGFIWTNREIQALQAAMAQPRDSGRERGQADLQQAVQDVRSGQQKLSDQLADVQRKLASESGERKLLSDQLGSLSARVDALASANADSTAAPPQNPQRPSATPRSRR